MNDTSHLNRLIVTGKLDQNTPLEIVLDIAEAHGIDYSFINDPQDIIKLIDEINKENTWKLAKVKTDIDYEKMALFLNPYVNLSWDRNQLETGYLFYKSFSNPKEFSKLTPDFKYGNQIPNDINLLNGCIVYAACKYFNIELEQTDSIDNIVLKLRNFLASYEYILLSINNRLIDLDIKELLHVDYLIYDTLHKKSNESIKEIKSNSEDIQSKTAPIPKKSNESNSLNQIKEIRLDSKSEDNRGNQSISNPTENIQTIKPISNLTVDNINKKVNDTNSTVNRSIVPSSNKEHLTKDTIYKKIDSLSLTNKKETQSSSKSEDILGNASNLSIKASYIKPTYDELEKLSTDISIKYPNESALLSYKIVTHIDAIVIASLCYGYNLIDETDPLLTFNKIEKKEELPKRVLEFNGDYPMSMYKSAILRRFLIDRGYSNQEAESMNKRDLFELLQIMSLSNNFYSGICKPHKNSETPFDLNDIKVLSEDECVSFGSQGDYTIFTYKELYNLYSNKKVLQDPLKKDELLSNFNIKKLIKICDSKDEIKTSLRKLIIDLDNHQIDADNRIYEIINKIKEDKTETMQNAMEHFMRMLIDLSMNMRGWNGNSEYPIKNIHEMDEKLIDKRVNESLHNIDLYVENFPFPCGDILRLPLVKYQFGKYIRGDNHNGRTIKDRLDIIRNSQKDVYACIKLSSNWLVSSAYKYSKILGINPGFNIEEFKHV